MIDDLPLVLKDEVNLNPHDIEHIFAIFKRDFIDDTCILKLKGVDYKITVKPESKCACPFENKKKPERFWHIITKKEFDSKKRNNPCPEDREKNRIFCTARAKRIHWIKQTIENIDKTHIEYFFEDNSAPTHFLWDTKRFYMVLIKHLGNTNTLLVTAFPVYKNKYRDYKKRLKKYKER
jgi:hypothetical protein